MAESEKRSFERYTPILVLISLGLAFLVGVLWQKVRAMEGGKTTVTPTQQAAGQAQQAQPTTAPAISLDQIKQLFANDKLITFGDANRKVLFVEASDASCPYCHVAAGKNPELNLKVDPQGTFKLVSEGGTYLAPVPEMKKLVDSGKASFVYLYFPGHGAGELAAKAMHCAYEKNKFWEVHDLLMTNKGYDLLNSTVKNDITQASVLADFLKPVFNSADMVTCLQSGKYDSIIKSEQQLATSLGVRGTPGFFINTSRFPGAYDFNDMKVTVDAALK